MWSLRQSTTATSSVRYDGDPPVFALVEWGDVPIMFKSYPGVNVALSNQKVHEDVGWDAYLWVTDARRACEEIRVRGGRITREIEETYYEGVGKFCVWVTT